MARRASSGTTTARWAAIVAAVASVLVVGSGQPAGASHMTVTEVRGSAYGYSCVASLFGGFFACTPPGPTPTVSLAPDASNSPQSASVTSARAGAGPATFFSSGPIAVGTAGTLGPSGSVTSSANIDNVNASGQEGFTATNLASTCTASPTGVSGSTTITGGTLHTDNGDEDPTNSIPDHPAVDVTLDANPALNTTYEGHIHIGNTTDNFRYVFNEQVVNPEGSITVNAGHQYLLGPIAVGDLILGQVVCGVTLPPQPASDLVVGDITDTPDPVPPGGTVTYSVPVTNHGSDNASGITLFSSVSRGASITGGTTDDGGTCTVVRGKTQGLSCDLGALASNESETVTITVTPRRPGTITFTSSVSAAGTDDANPSDNTATEATAVVRP